MKHYFKAAVLIFALGPIVVLLGQACGQMQSAGSANLSSSTGNETGVSQPPGVPLPVGELSARESVRMVHNRELLQSTMAILNIPYSFTVYDTFAAVGSNLSDDGYTDGVSAPMMNSLLSINGTACNVTIGREKPLTAAERSIFLGVVFTKSPESQAATAWSDLIRVLARRAWLRNETAEERAMILESAKVFDGAVVADTTNKALFICSAMMTSLEAVAR